MFKRMCIYFLLAKLQAFYKFKIMKETIENQNKERIKIFNTNWAREFMSNDVFKYCKEKKIQQLNVTNTTY